jgi:hypothetical protein
MEINHLRISSHATSRIHHQRPFLFVPTDAKNWHFFFFNDDSVHVSHVPHATALDEVHNPI